MTRFSCLALAAVATSIAMPALANGIQPAPVHIAPAIVTPPSADWTGGYVGGSIGAFTGTSLFCDDGTPGYICDGDNSTSTLVPEADGAIYGITAGYDWQRGSIVYGIVGDYLISDAEAQAPSDVSFACGGTCDTALESIAMLRARVGYDAGAFLPYLTAGVALATYEVGFTAPTTSVNSDTVMHGVIGVGADYRLTDNFTLGLEYLHLIESDDSVFMSEPDGCPNNCGATNFEGNIVRATVAYRF